MREFLQDYIRRNFQKLLKLDLRMARLIGAPSPHTLSSWAYVKSPFWRKFIDKLFWWLFNEADHCKQDYERTTL